MQQSSSNAHDKRLPWNGKSVPGNLKSKPGKFHNRLHDPETQRSKLPGRPGLAVGTQGSRRKNSKKSDWQDDSGLHDSVESARIDISKAYHSCVNNYNKLSSSRRDDTQPISDLGALNDFNVGSSCSIYVTEISSPNLFLGIENNKQLKQSFQTLKRKLEQCARGFNEENQGPASANVYGSESLQSVLGSFVCVNDPAEGFSRGFVVSNVNQICDVYLIDWGYINTYQASDVWPLSREAFEFCQPLAKLFEIAGSPTDIPFPEGLALPALFHVKVMTQKRNELEAIVVKVKYRGRDMIDYYYEPGLLKQMEEAAADHHNQQKQQQQQQKGGSNSGGGGTGGDTWGGGGGQRTQGGGAGGGDESSSATNSVVEEWLLNTADEQFSHFDEGPPSPTDDEALANLMEEFELGDSVSAVVNQPQHQFRQHFNHQQQVPSQHQNNFRPHLHSSPGAPRFVSNFNACLPNPPHTMGIGGVQSGRNDIRMAHSPYHQRQQGPSSNNNNSNSNNNPNSPGQTQGNRTVTSLPSISTLLQIKAGSSIQIFISYVVLPTFFNFIPINNVSTGLREKLNSLLTEVITDPEKVSIRTEPSSGRPIFSMGQFFVAAVRGQPRRITVKPGHTALEQSGMLKLQDVDYGGEAVLRSDQVFMIPASIAAALSTIPVLRCNGSITALHPNSANRRWTPEQCQVFRHLTENCTLTATVAKVSMSPQMSVPYYNFELYSSDTEGVGKNVAISDVMRAFEYATSATTSCGGNPQPMTSSVSAVAANAQNNSHNSTSPYHNALTNQTTN